MQTTYTEGQTFEKKDFTVNLLPKGEYENCTFNQCNFAGTDLSQYKFIDCAINSCNLSMVRTDKTSWQNIRFKDSKILGLRFDTCLDFGLSFSFENCQLNHASFYKTKIKKTIFKNSHLEGADFSECDLSGAIFDNCDLLSAVFENTILEKADFRTSYNYSIDPEINRIKKARFSIHGVAGLLNKYQIEIEG